MAQQALAALQGSGELYEAYANYNVGKSLLELGRCAEAIPYFDRSEQIQGERQEITRDRKAAEKCALSGEGMPGRAACPGLRDRTRPAQPCTSHIRDGVVTPGRPLRTRPGSDPGHVPLRRWACGSRDVSVTPHQTAWASGAEALGVLLLVVRAELAGLDRLPPGAVVPVPGDRPLEAVGQLLLRLPAERAQLRRVERVPPVVPRTVLDVADEPRIGAGQLDDPADELEVLALLAADVVDLAGAPSRSTSSIAAQWSSA